MTRKKTEKLFELIPLPLHYTRECKCPASQIKLSLGLTDVTSNPIHLSHCGGRQGSGCRQVHHSSEPAPFHPRVSVMLSRNGVTHYYTHATYHPVIPQSPLREQKTAKSQEGRITDMPPSEIDFPLRRGALMP